MNKVILNAGRERSVLHRHPWIFSGAIREVVGAPTIGETVAVTSAKGEMLGWGSYSPQSQIRVRMLSWNREAQPDAAYVTGLLAASIGRRADFWANARTNAFRLVHGESDGLPGVVVDYYDGWCVTQLASAGAEYWKETIVRAVQEFVPGCKGVYNRSDVDSRVREGLVVEGTTGVLAGEEPPEYIEIQEDDIRYLVDVRKGHKTGFYLDQREARATVGAYANGTDMLNCFCYTGGFGLAARAAGAMSVTQLDISSAALALAKRNADLAHVCGTTCDYVEADVFKQLRLYRDQGRSFDLIVLDPPKFADTKGQVMRATRGYKDINLLAMKLLRPNGLLATFSCSGAISPDLFETVCREAAWDANRSFQIVTRMRQAADHPVALSFPEGLYLKGLLLRAV